MECLLDTNMRSLFIVIIAFLVCSCCSINNYDYQHIKVKEIPKEAVNIAITDYSKILRKRKDLSNITAVELYISDTSTDWFYIATKPWLPTVDDKGEYHLTDDKFPLEVLNKYIGQIPPSWIPTDYAEKDNVLYVWHDPKVVLTENVKSILNKYDLIYYPGDLMTITTDGGDISYIFCKYNYKKKYYQKIKAPFNTPLPSCGCH